MLADYINKGFLMMSLSRSSTSQEQQQRMDEWMDYWWMRQQQERDNLFVIIAEALLNLFRTRVLIIILG